MFFNMAHLVCQNCTQFFVIENIEKPLSHQKIAVTTEQPHNSSSYKDPALAGPKNYLPNMEILFLTEPLNE